MISLLSRLGPGTVLVRDGAIWRFFSDCLELRMARETAEVGPLLDWVGATDAVAGWIAYEAAPAMDSALQVVSGSGPLAVFGRFGSVESFAEIEGPPLNFPGLRTEIAITREEFDRRLAAVHEALGEGRVYQVNLTHGLRVPVQSPAATFAALCEPGPPPYAALVWLEEDPILSLSPELFYQREGDRITMRPMKGTRRPGDADELKTSEKDHAENLMIVDMVRNDLGRIARPGSVHVPQIFEIESYPSVAQMTSTVMADIPSVSLRETFEALFPCASITGAPKVEAMRVIAELEGEPRGVYCGAIGFRLAEREVFSVAIRTLSRGRYGVGFGAVWESSPDDEWAECQTKAAVLDLDPDWGLLESILWTLEDGYHLLEDHLDRMRASALALGFPWSDPVLPDALEAPVKFRLILRRDGQFEFNALPLGPWPELLEGRLAPFPVSSASPWLRHKTTHRAIYERAGPTALLYNERGELCEFSTGNIVLERSGERWTPPPSSGCLPGVQVGSDNISHRVLTLEDLREAEAVWHVNSVRGWTLVNIIWE